MPSPSGGYATFTYQYDSIGNMTYRSDLGVMTYGEGLSPETYYTYDGLGSVVNLSDVSGVNLQSYSYDAFGNEQGHSPAGTDPNNRQFLTKELDSSGLIYFGARYYDPRIGRWITQDPAGMVDGPNMYMYTGNDPVNAFDPFGLDTVLIPGIAKFGFGGRKSGWSNKISIRNNLEKIGENVMEFNWSGGLLDKKVYSSLTTELIRNAEIARINGQSFNIVAQSWGAVVALEVLKASGLAVDNFITIGAPLTGLSGRGVGINNWTNLFSALDPISWGAILQFKADEQINVISAHFLDFENPIVGFLVGDILFGREDKCR